MSDPVLIALIIAVAVVVVLVIFRDKLSRFSFKTKNIDANMETHNPEAVNITKASMKGEENLISVQRGNVNVSEFDQDGKGQKLDIK